MQLVIVVASLSAMSDISQGSVTTPMRCGALFRGLVLMKLQVFFADFDSERILKIS